MASLFAIYGEKQILRKLQRSSLMFFECEKWNLFAGSTVHGIRDETDKCVCVQHENKVCVHSLAYVSAAGGHLAQEMCFIDII